MANWFRTAYVKWHWAGPCRLHRNLSKEGAWCFCKCCSKESQPIVTPCGNTITVLEMYLFCQKEFTATIFISFQFLVWFLTRLRWHRAAGPPKTNTLKCKTNFYTCCFITSKTEPNISLFVLQMLSAWLIISTSLENKSIVWNGTHLGWWEQQCSNPCLQELSHWCLQVTHYRNLPCP